MCIFKKIIPIFIFLSISLTSHAAQQLPEAAPEWGFVSKIQALYQQEAALKSTATYRSLVAAEIIATSLLKYATLGPWGVLGDAAYRLGQHNASSAVIPVAERFLPPSLHSKFRQFVTAGIMGLHGYDCYLNPAQQTLGYAFGLTGAFLTKHVLDQSSLGQRSRKECEAFVYYCCRKAGWETAEIFDEFGSTFLHQLLNTLPGFIPLNLELSTAEIEEITLGGYQVGSIQHAVNGTCPNLFSITTMQEKLEPCISSHLPNEYCLAYENIYDNPPRVFKELVGDLSSASLKGQFGVIIGEKHSKVSNLLLEISILKLARSMGVEDLLVELPSTAFDKALERCLSTSLPSSELICKKIQVAASLGMKITPIDHPDRPLYITPARNCKTYEAVFNETREGAMCENMESFKKSFVALVGHMHLSYFANRCKGLEDTFVSYITLHPEKDSIEKEKATLAEFQNCSPYVSERYKEFLSFSKNSILKSIKPNLNPLLTIDQIYDLFMLGVISIDEIPEDF